MPHLKLPSGTEMFYAIPTCTDEAVALDKPYIDPSRPTLLLLHGASSDSRAWVEQIQDPVLNQNFNLVCLDLPFLGLTRTPRDWKHGQEPIPIPREGEIPTSPPKITMEEYAEDCVQLVKKLRLPQLHLVANGCHTAISCYLLLKYPELWKSAIFLSPASLVESQHNKQQFADVWRSFLEDDGDDAHEITQGFYCLFFGPRSGPEPERREYWNRVWQTYLGTGQSKSYVFGQWASSITLREEYTDDQVKNGFTVPICLASGNEHIMWPSAHADIEAVLAKSTACPFYESHHLGMAPTMAQITHPREVNRIICKFIARCEGKRHSVYDAQVFGYNKNWDKAYASLEAAHWAKEEQDGTPKPSPKSHSKSGGLYSLVQAMRRPSTT